MKRREFIALLGGAAAAGRSGARAAARAGAARRRTHAWTADDSNTRPATRRFSGLGQLGWTVGRNVRIDYRWGAGDADRYRATRR